MNKWLSNLLIILHLGGGFAGLAQISHSFIFQRNHEPPILAGVVGLILYSFGIISGFAIMHKAKCARVLSIIYQSVQIPFINTSIIYYGFYSGCIGSVLFQKDDVGFFFRIGSGIDLVISPDSYFTLGINFTALALLILLTKKPNNRAIDAHD